MTKRRLITAYIVFCSVAFLMQVFPLYAIGNRALPIVLGMPFSMFWIVMWISIQFIGLVIFYRLWEKFETMMEGG